MSRKWASFQGHCALHKRYCTIDSIGDSFVHMLVGYHDSSLVHSDMNSLHCAAAGTFRFEWEAWWSGYTLFVMLRRKPKLHLVRDFAEKASVVSLR